MGDIERLEFAQWVLERNLGWIASAEVKVGVVVAIDTAMLATLAAAFSTANQGQLSAWAYLFTLIGAGAGALGLLCAAVSLLPRVAGPNSLIFFGTVAQHPHEIYAKELLTADATALLADCVAQIHRNAQIAREKFSWVRKAMAWSFASVPPWIIALGLLVNA